MSYSLKYDQVKIRNIKLDCRTFYFLYKFYLLFKLNSIMSSALSN